MPGRRMTPMTLNLYSLAHPVTALGPGTRVVLWVAGCDKRCADCISPEMQDPAAGTPVPVDVLLRRLLRLEPELDGITVSGGEPFDQAPALMELFTSLRAERPGWSIMVYSGYAIEEIQADPAGRARLLEQVDILIDGRFERDVPPNQAFMGSGNQRVHYLTVRGKTLRAAMESAPMQQMNFGVGGGAFDMLIGVTSAETRRDVCEALDRRRKPCDDSIH